MDILERNKNKKQFIFIIYLCIHLFIKQWMQGHFIAVTR